MPLPSRDELLKKVRQKQAEMSKGRKDPDEFRCPKAKDKEKLEYQFYVLPGLDVGDVIKGGGTVEAAMEMWYTENGFHFINNQKYECPRIHGEQCSWCNTGFDLMRDNDDKDFKQRVSQMYMARSHFAINVYFPNIKSNPEAVRGKVMWFNAPRTVWEKMDACINSDDPGDEERPKACGIFYHPTEGCYRFSLTASKKGDFNTYEESSFIPNSFGPLVKIANDPEKKPDLEAIQALLDQRHHLPSKFQAPDAAKLDELLSAVNAKEQGKDTEEVAEKKAAAKPAAGKPATSAAKPAAVAAKPAAARPAPAVKPAAKPAAPPPVEEEEPPPAAEEAPAEEAAAEAPAEEVPAEEAVAEAPAEEAAAEAPAEEAAAEAPAEEAPAEEAAAEAPVEEEPPPPPVAKPAAAKPAAKPAAVAPKAAAPAAKPAVAVAAKPAPATKPAVAVAAKPAAKPAAVAAKPAAAKPAAAAPATATAVAEEDPELQNLLGAIKGSKKA